ncbi:MAG: hypothetical protein RMZ41_010490 [Nostoc sp. DedVER02]|uniref:hypothetical protein n=1 Tax=unclassified Nostoc TaxID=2593658 RepID=UPI002AD3444E|nr:MULTISPECIES: hypothetical protein [unclassified Nostoc]MDZ7986333.1 hypothetical protein [Nostoc sp. DedVER02]MDZ8112723.1 hypothetical protein [Nostoc sp. DedVER01b]
MSHPKHEVRSQLDNRCKVFAEVNEDVTLWRSHSLTRRFTDKLKLKSNKYHNTKLLLWGSNRQNNLLKGEPMCIA